MNPERKAGLLLLATYLIALFAALVVMRLAAMEF